MKYRITQVDREKYNFFRVEEYRGTWPFKFWAYRGLENSYEGALDLINKIKGGWKSETVVYLE